MRHRKLRGDRLDNNVLAPRVRDQRKGAFRSDEKINDGRRAVGKALEERSRWNGHPDPTCQREISFEQTSTRSQPAFAGSAHALDALLGVLSNGATKFGHGFAQHPMRVDKHPAFGHVRRRAETIEVGQSETQAFRSL